MKLHNVTLILFKVQGLKLGHFMKKIKESKIAFSNNCILPNMISILAFVFCFLPISSFTCMKMHYNVCNKCIIHLHLLCSIYCIQWIFQLPFACGGFFQLSMNPHCLTHKKHYSITSPFLQVLFK